MLGTLGKDFWNSFERICWERQRSEHNLDLVGGAWIGIDIAHASVMCKFSHRPFALKQGILTTVACCCALLRSVKNKQEQTHQEHLRTNF